MPINYNEYPANWKTEIRPAVMARAGEVRDTEGKIIQEARCEECGVLNHEEGWRGSDGEWYTFKKVDDDLNLHGIDYFDTVLKHCLKKDMTAKKMSKICLTVAHLDHDKANHEVTVERLRAWCQRCHLNYDRDHHNDNRRNNLKKKKLIIDMFTEKEADGLH